MKKTLYLMRHGQTWFNVLRKIQGWCDSPLTDVGMAQALIAKEYFIKHNIRFDAAYSSTSERASDTLELVIEGKMPYTRLKGLKERNFGRFEGESEDLNPAHPYNDFFVPYGGETEETIQQRISSTLESIMMQENHECVFVVSHAGAITHFKRIWKQYECVSYQEKLPNAAILRFEFDDVEKTFSLQEVVEHDFSRLEN